MTLSRAASSSSDGPHTSDHLETSGVTKVRRPRLEYGDGSAMWQLARESGVLEENAEYTYHMFTHFFGEASVVAEVDGVVVGFIAGFRPPDRGDTVFVWQIAVDEAARGQGLARTMLHGIIQRLAPDVRYLEATVSPSNDPSQRTFRGIARDLDTVCNEEILFPADRFHGPSHEDEVLFRIGPIDPERIEAYARQQAQDQADENQQGNRNVVVES